MSPKEDAADVGFSLFSFPKSVRCRLGICGVITGRPSRGGADVFARNASAAQRQNWLAGRRQPPESDLRKTTHQPLKGRNLRRESCRPSLGLGKNLGAHFRSRGLTPHGYTLPPLRGYCYDELTVLTTNPISYLTSRDMRRKVRSRIR